MQKIQIDNLECDEIYWNAFTLCDTLHSFPQFI